MDGMIQVDVTAELTKENADLMQQIKRLKQQNKELKKDIKRLNNTLERYREALDAKMDGDKNIEYRGKKEMEINYMEIDEKA